MLTFRDGRPLARILGGANDGEIIFIEDNMISKDNISSDNNSFSDSDRDTDSNSDDKIGDYIKLKEGKLDPLLNVNERSVSYIAGPSGSGKTSYAVRIIKNYCKLFPNKEFYIFSRTDCKNDPAFRGMKIHQIDISERLLENPIDIEKELTGGSILLFDDCNTIQNDKLKKYIDNLMADIMEIGRKLDITIVITNHLVIPNEKKIARTIMNEMQSLTVFPKSGSSQQISHTLRTYFGLDKSQIQKILGLKTRWVTIIKNYPMCVIYETGIYIL